jgi:putative nucleotidyltransferase with HDIG domain
MLTLPAPERIAVSARLSEPIVASPPSLEASAAAEPARPEIALSEPAREWLTPSEQPPPCTTSAPLRLSEIIAALSYALDITEGQPEGHAVRSCLIGMRLAREVGVSPAQQSALFYALLLKDLGCSSNAAKVCALFGADDRVVKHALKTVDWPRLSQSFLYAARHAAAGRSPFERALRIVTIGLHGQRGARQLVRTRCEHGAEIARLLELPDQTAEAIRVLDEHWDGRGHPDGLRGREIPLLGRILGLAQTVEVFFTTYGVATAYAMAAERRGQWFDPDLVDALDAIHGDTQFWDRLGADDVRDQIAALEPAERVLLADDDRLDQVARAFALVIDSKSPWTYRHSERVADLAVGIADLLGFDADEIRDLRRAALLHDVGKLGISNLVLDKPGPLTDDERAVMRQHTEYTLRILERVTSLRRVAEVAASHHERLDGQGYHRGVPSGALPRTARVLPVADVYEALSAERPYRAALPPEQVLAMMARDVGPGLCPDAFAALQTLVARQQAAAVPAPAPALH